jgi:hypothetical protein
MGASLTQLLDRECERFGLEWLVLPFEESPDSWSSGPFWAALVIAQYPPRSGIANRFFHYNGLIEWGLDKKPDPDVVFLALEPMGRPEAKRLLLAQLA